MNKEEIDLLRYDLIIEYYKNKDITTRYRRMTDNTVIDNEILDNLKDTLFITTLSKYSKLQQENKQLKDIINKIKMLMNKNQCVEDCYRDVDNYLQELENGDSNE